MSFDEVGVGLDLFFVQLLLSLGSFCKCYNVMLGRKLHKVHLASTEKVRLENLLEFVIGFLSLLHNIRGRVLTASIASLVAVCPCKFCLGSVHMPLSSPPIPFGCPPNLHLSCQCIQYLDNKCHIIINCAGWTSRVHK